MAFAQGRAIQLAASLFGAAVFVCVISPAPAALAQSPSPGDIAISVSRDGNTVAITLTASGLSLTSPINAQVVESGGPAIPATMVQAGTSPVTVTMLLDPIAGGGANDASLLQGMISGVISTLQPTDYITVAVATWQSVINIDQFTWIPIAPSHDLIAQVISSTQLHQPQTNTEISNNNSNLLLLYNKASNIAGNGHYVILITNGIGLNARQLKAPSALVALKGITPPSYLPSTAGQVIQTYIQANGYYTLEAPSLTGQLASRVEAARPDTLVFTYSTSATAATPAELQIGDAKFSFNVPQGAIPPTPTPQSTQAPTPSPTVILSVIPTPEPAAPATLPGILPLIGGIIVVAVGVILAAVIVNNRRPRPYLLIGKRKLPLRQPMWLDQGTWLGVADVGLHEQYAHLAPYGRDGWVITVSPNDMMRVDGLRSRKNLLHSGATVTLGENEQAAFTYIDPRYQTPGDPGGEKS